MTAFLQAKSAGMQATSSLQSLTVGTRPDGAADGQPEGDKQAESVIIYDYIICLVVTNNLLLLVVGEPVEPSRCDHNMTWRAITWQWGATRDLAHVLITPSHHRQVEGAEFQEPDSMLHL